jgi:hypothetical protein
VGDNIKVEYISNLIIIRKKQVEMINENNKRLHRLNSIINRMIIERNNE